MLGKERSSATLAIGEKVAKKKKPRRGRPVEKRKKASGVREQPQPSEPKPRCRARPLSRKRVVKKPALKQ